MNNIKQALIEHFLPKKGRVSRLYGKLFPRPYPKLMELVRTFDQSRTPPQVLYLGDSVVERVAHEDTDRRPLNQMVLDALRKNYTGLSISYSAYNPQVFYYLLAALERMKHKPKIVILPINMRCFSPQWDMQPQWQHEEEIQILEKYIENPQGRIGSVTDRSMRIISPSQFDLFNETRVNYPLSSLNRIGQFIKLIESKPITQEEAAWRRQQIFIFHYTHPLATDHRRLVALINIFTLLARMDVKTFAYITPINREAGERYVGPEFRNQVKANVDMLSNQVLKHVNPAIQTLRDYSFRCPARAFFQDNLATEHLNQLGRLELTHLIAEEVLQL
jgi:hypothetical protein